MMTRFLTTLAAGTSLLALAGMAHADPVVGEPAPAFEATTATGEAIALSDFAGETVILEWTNHGCPYVQKHYDGQNMQQLQASAASDGGEVDIGSWAMAAALRPQHHERAVANAQYGRCGASDARSTTC